MNTITVTGGFISFQFTKLTWQLASFSHSHASPINIGPFSFSQRKSLTNCDYMLIHATVNNFQDKDKNCKQVSRQRGCIDQLNQNLTLWIQHFSQRFKNIDQPFTMKSLLPKSLTILKLTLFNFSYNKPNSYLVWMLEWNLKLQHSQNKQLAVRYSIPERHESFPHLQGRLGAVQNSTI